MAKTYSVQFGTGDPRTLTGLNPTLLIFVNISSGATLVAPSFTEALTGSGIYKFSYGTTTPIAFLADAATTSPGSSARYVVGQIDPADRSDEYGNSIVAFGSTLIGYGTSTVAFGTTIVAIGTTLIGYGTSTVAFGATLFGQGVTNIALGTTNVALGTSAVALGTTNIGYGVSNLAQGLTTLGYGVSIYNQVQAMGVSLIAVGNSLAAIGASFGGIVSAIGSTASSFGDSTTDPVDLFGYLKRVRENLEGDSTFVKLTGAWSIYDRSGNTLLIAKTVSNNSSQVIKS